MTSQPDPIVVEVTGPRIRLEENEAIREQLLSHIGQGHTRLVLDFKDVEFVDSSFLGLLIIVLKRATAAGGDIRICCLQPPLQNIFDLMRLNRLFQIHESREKAVASFQ